MVNVSRLNEPHRTIKIGAMNVRGRTELFCLRVCCVLTLACAEDDVVPGVKQTIATPPPAPIVDMSASAERPLLPQETPGVAPISGSQTPASPVIRAVPARGSVVVAVNEIAALRARKLAVPVVGIKAAELVASFHDARGGRVHEALDIAAPRGTPVVSADDGTVLKLFTSRAGGLTAYVADPTRRFIYYYAHLDAYAPSLREGQPVAKGSQIGTVGTTGNADVNTPHLHFAILRNDDMTKWWTGTPLDPHAVLR